MGNKSKKINKWLALRLVQFFYLFLPQVAFSWGCSGMTGKTGRQTSGQKGTWHLGWALLCRWEENQARRRQKDFLLIIYKEAWERSAQTASVLRNENS